MFTGLACCSTRLKESAYRSNGGLGSFPFAKCTSTVLQRSISAIAVGSSGSVVVYVDESCLVLCIVPSDTSSTDILTSPPSQILDLSTKVAKLYPFIDFTETDSDHGTIVIFGHTGIHFSLILFAIDSTMVPAGVDCKPSVHSISESDSFSCAASVRGSRLVICGTTSGRIHVVSSDNDDFGNPVHSFEPLFSVKGACISDITCDGQYVYVCTDEVPEILVYTVDLTSKNLVQAQSISLSIPNLIFPLQIKSLLRPFSSLLADTSRHSPSGSLYVRTDRVIARYSLDTSKVVAYEVLDASQLFFGPFDNGPVMSVDMANERMACWENVCGRLRRSSEAKIDGIVQVVVSPNRQIPRLFVVTKNEQGQYFLQTWGLRGLVN